MKKGAFTFRKPSLKTLQKIKETGFTFIITNHQNIDAKLLTHAKQKGLETWMEVNCFAGEELWKKFPNSRPIIKGKPLEKLGPENNKWYAGVIPRPEVIKDRLYLIKTLLSKNLSFKTLYLDFCRFPGRWEDGKKRAIFAENTENNLQKRQEIITDFARKAAKLCQEQNVSLGIFLTPYDNKEYGQNLVALKNLCQYFSPMLYHKICQQEVGWIKQRLNHYLQEFKKGVLPIIQSTPEPAKISPREFKLSIKLASEKTEGVIILSWEETNKPLRQVFKKFFSS